MGGHPYWYFVPYEEDVGAALQSLRRREFAAGRYNPVIRFLEFSQPTFSRQCPGSQHATIEAAVESAGDAGTRSILDISAVGTESGLGTAGPLEPERLVELYGTEKPCRAMVEAMDVLEDVERGCGIYVIIYDGDRPSEICFAGCSYD